jgi:hypothetical protein
MNPYLFIPHSAIAVDKKISLFPHIKEFNKNTKMQAFIEK